MIRCPEHPRASDYGGYVFEHVLIMEKKLGRKLIWAGPGAKETEIIHHINGKKDDNRFAEHMAIHNAIKKKGGQYAI